MLRDGAGDSLLAARTSAGVRRSMCGRDKGAFFGKADVNWIQAQRLSAGKSYKTPKPYAPPSVVIP
jgi:hypothetical protein